MSKVNFAYNIHIILANDAVEGRLADGFELLINVHLLEQGHQVGSNHNRGT